MRVNSLTLLGIISSGWFVQNASLADPQPPRRRRRKMAVKVIELDVNDSTNRKMIDSALKEKIDASSVEIGTTAKDGSTKLVEEKNKEQSANLVAEKKKEQSASVWVKSENRAIIGRKRNEDNGKKDETKWEHPVVEKLNERLMNQKLKVIDEAPKLMNMLLLSDRRLSMSMSMPADPTTTLSTMDGLIDAALNNPSSGNSGAVEGTTNSISVPSPAAVVLDDGSPSETTPDLSQLVGDRAFLAPTDTAAGNDENGAEENSSASSSLYMTFSIISSMALVSWQL